MRNRTVSAMPPQRLYHPHLHTLTRIIVPVLVLIIGFTGSSVHAELATAEQSQFVCTNWLSQSVARFGGWAGVSDPTVEESGLIEANGVNLARYYNISPDGYVVVPTLMEMTPVKMYSDHGHLDASETDGPTQMLREVLELRYRDFVDAFGDASVSQPAGGGGLFAPEQREAWNTLAVPARLFKPSQALGIDNVGPLLTSSWHQGGPYNNDCPVGQSGLSVVGCTATATSQILKFWEWPSSGFGSHSYLWNGDNSCGGTPTAPATLVADYSDPYDWANMRDSCDDGTGCNATQQAALAELNHEVGVVVEMHYGSCGSGASANCALARIPYYLKYDWGMTNVCRKDYDLNGWFAIIQAEINAGRPIQYGITSHSIVCDGWRTDGSTHEFHMNYGWGQGNNAWYVLDNLSCSWVSGGICPSIVENMIIGIQPETSSYATYDGVIVSEVAGDGDDHADPGETWELAPIVRNLGWAIANANATLTTTDTYVTIVTGTADFKSSLVRGQWDTTATNLAVEIDPGCPDPHVVELTLHVEEDGGFARDYVVQIGVGDVPGFEDDMESGDGYWHHGAVTELLADQWHLEDYRSNGGSYSWKFGSSGAVGYSDGADAGLTTPPIVLAPGSQLDFSYYVDAESGVGANTAWDGGIVMISENGRDWTKLTPVGGYPFNNTGTDSELQFDGATGFFSGSEGWDPVQFDLSGYEGSVQLMFRFGSDGGAHGEGWYVDDVWVGNTPVGSDIVISLMPGFECTFATVSGRGNTWVEGKAGPTLPNGFASVPNDEPVFCDAATTASVSGITLVTASYDEADVEGNESALRLMAYTGGTWQDITMMVNQTANTITGLANSLGTMVIVEPSGCCLDRVGDANGLGGDEPTIGDVSVMIDAKFITGTCDGILECLTESDINQSGGADATCDDITIGDISILIDYLFITGPSLVLPDCL